MSLDPSRTITLRKKFINDFKRRYRRVGKDVEDLLIGKDVFGLKSSKNHVLNVEAQTRQWAFHSDPNKLKEFENWIQEETGLVIVPEENRFWEDYVQQGYERGAGRAFQQVNSQITSIADTRGLSFIEGAKGQFVAGMVSGPETVEKIQLLVSRTFTDIQGINGQLSTVLRQELANGLVQGDNPRKIASRMRDRLSRTQKQAERIARTEIIRSHAEGQLDALKRMGVQRVGVQVEWVTAGDDRVCHLCADMEGKIFEIDKAHNLIPLHPNCRCAFFPSLSGVL